MDLSSGRRSIMQECMYTCWQKETKGNLWIELVLFQTASEATSLEVSKRPNPKFVCVSVCMCVCLSVCLSVFYLLDHWRDRNEIFRSCRHQPLDNYYILKTYCYYLDFKVICENPVSRLILVTHIHTYVAQEKPWLTSYLTFYLLPPFLLPTSFATSYLNFYLLPPTSYLPLTSLSTPYLPPTSLCKKIKNVYFSIFIHTKYNFCLWLKNTTACNFLSWPNSLGMLGCLRSYVFQQLSKQKLAIWVCWGSLLNFMVTKHVYYTYNFKKDWNLYKRNTVF